MRCLPLVRAHKPALLSLLTEPRRLWLIQHADEHWESHSFCPPASLAEVAAWYPDALRVEPEAPPVPAHRQPQTARQAPAHPDPCSLSIADATASESPV